MKTNLIKKILLMVALLLLCFAKQYAQTVYTVVYTTDAMPGVTPAVGQLRWAIQEANANPGPSIINFNIPGGGPQAIDLLNTLPVITKRSVIIDATTQPGYDFNDPGNPMIILDGYGVLATGLVFDSCERAKVSGLYIKSFGIGIYLRYSTNCEIRNNMINGISSRNIHLSNSHFNTVKGNYINVDKTLASTGTNSHEGIFIQSSNDNIIGGQKCGEANMVGYVYSEGIDNYNATGQRNLYSGNILFENDIGFSPRYEIYLRITGNGGKPSPVITATGCDVSGTSGANNVIELFGSPGPAATTLNARVYMGSTQADASGQWTMPVTNIVYPFVTATATDLTNNTSELCTVSAIALDSLNLQLIVPQIVCTKEKTVFGIKGGKCLKGISYQIDYGDGSGATSSLEHIYGGAGNYMVTVTAFDDVRCQPLTKTTLVNVKTVEDCNKFECAPSCNYTLGTYGLSTSVGPGFTSGNEASISSTTLHAYAQVVGGIGPFTFSWTVSGNVTSWNYSAIPGPSNRNRIEVIVPDLLGSYSATVKVTDAAGCTTYKTVIYPN